jgi:hypothetical protein
VVIQLTDLANTPREVEAAIEPEGLDIRVDAVPVGPSNVGRFVGQIATEPDLVDLHYVRTDGVTFMGFSLPERWDGELTLLLGRPARSGEGYETFSNAFAPGEPLACTDTLGDALRVVAARLPGYDITVADLRLGGDAPEITLLEALDQGLGDEPITGAVLTSADHLAFSIGSHTPPAEVPEC